MTPAEQRALKRAAVLLLVSGAVRWGWEVHRGPPVAPPGKEDAGPRLLAEARALKAEQDRRAQPLAEGERVDPNVATEVELDRLPGVGAATARAIVSAREAAGGFRAPEALLEVKGIGPATLERMRPWLELGDVPVETRLRRGRRAATAGGRPAAAAGAADRVDLNRADEADLVTLPGIGPALAGRILAERERRGRFRSVDELLEVRGIGPATLERLRDRVVVR